MGMKRNYLYILLILAIVSCSKTEEKTSEIQAEYSPKFYADLGTAYTKTFVDDCLQIYWNKNDKISVFTSTANQLYKFDGDTGDSEGEFSVVEIDKSSTGERLAIDANFAVYPFQEETTISSDGTLTMSVPEIQYYSKKGFGLDSNPMVAVTENKNDTFLSFKNVCGYLRLFLYGENITAKRIRLEGNLKEPLSGKADVVMSYGQEPDISLHGDSHTITLDCSDGVKLGQSSDTATEFWFVLPPVNFTNGFTIIIEDDCGNKYTKSTYKQIEVKRNTVSNMAVSTLDQLLSYNELVFEQDGVDAIFTEDGFYAIVKELPESTDFVFMTGNINTDSQTIHMLISKSGYVRAIDLGNGTIVPVIYTSDSLVLLNDSGETISEIPFTEFTEKPEGNNSRAWNCMLLLSTIYEYLGLPADQLIKSLMLSIVEGERMDGSNLTEMIQVISMARAKVWYANVKKTSLRSCFGNIQVTTLDAIKENNMCTFTLPAEVSGITPYNGFSCKYTLMMETGKDSNEEPENQKKEKIIPGNTIERFTFSFENLGTKYYYKASLILDCTFETIISKNTFERVSRLTPYANWTPGPQSHDFKYIIEGNMKTLTTDSVSSTVVSVENVKFTSADVICSFSDVPEGAKCEVVINSGANYSSVYSGAPDMDNQIIHVDGLSPATSYIASSRISYNGKTYNGSQIIPFSTTSPSGTLISVYNERITTTSAVIKCNFSNVENGVECGIIVNGEDGAKRTVPASSIEGLQDVSISGLKPATTYTCTSYVRLGTYYKEGNSLSFTTKLPDVTGTWNCREKHYKTNGEEYYQTYSVTLHDDGTVTTTLYDSFIGATWGRSKTALSVNIHLTAPQYAGPYWIGSDSGHDLSILFDDPTNPTSGKGRAKTWAVSAMTGTGSSHYFDLEMTK